MEVITTYLQMLAPLRREAVPPPDDANIINARHPTIDYYRFLYDAVGRHWQWIDRKKLSDPELATIIHDPLVEVHVLMVEGVPAGYVELDRRVAGDIELAYFGLTPEFIGRGLGKYLLFWAVDKAWSYRPRRVWVHTCTLDHAAALPNYEKAGFTIYKEETKDHQAPG
jgi:GNAT superfamily N-acetyltransferase